MSVIFSGEAQLANATNEVGPCGICFEEADLLNVCSNDSCSARFCAQCWGAHIRTTVDMALYAVPKVKCPGCNNRVKTAAWFPQAEPDVRQRYLENARVLLSVRCCGIASFFQPQQSEDPQALEQSIFGEISEPLQLQLRSAWLRYDCGTDSAEMFLQSLLSALQAPCEANAGNFGQLQAIFAPSKLPALIADPERRVALQLAILQRFPMTCTPCCGGQICFRCKTAGWHSESCAERQQKEMGLKVCFCPHCGVPTIKSEGCDHMVCVCGQDWTFGVDPIAQALRTGNKSVIMPLLCQMSDVNAVLESSGEKPMDIFLRSFQAGPEASEIIGLFARLGARASPAIFHDRLREAAENTNLELFKTLIDLIMPLLCQMSGVSAVRDGMGKAMDILLENFQAGPEASEMIHMFARLGARASPAIYHYRLREAVDCTDLELFKTLMDLFVGVSTNGLTAMLELIFGEIFVSPPKNDFAQRAHTNRVAMASALIERGACVEGALYDSNVKNFHHCPDALVSVLACAHIHQSECDSERQGKDVREFAICTSRGRDARHRFHILEKKRLHEASKRKSMERPHMGKCGVAKHTKRMLEIDFTI